MQSLQFAMQCNKTVQPGAHFSHDAPGHLHVPSSQVLALGVPPQTPKPRRSRSASVPASPPGVAIRRAQRFHLADLEAALTEGSGQPAVPVFRGPPQAELAAAATAWDAMGESQSAGPGVLVPACGLAPSELAAVAAFGARKKRGRPPPATAEEAAARVEEQALKRSKAASTRTSMAKANGEAEAGPPTRQL